MIIDVYGNFYLSEPLSLGQGERDTIEKLKQHLLLHGTKQVYLIVNLTWFSTLPSDNDALVSWVNKHGGPDSVEILFVAQIDGGEWFTRGEAYQKLKTLGYTVKLIGFGPDCWFSFMPGLIKEYSEDELMLSPDMTYKYLCYNRKPRPHRVELVKQLISSNLLRHGWTTFEHGYFEEVDILSDNTDKALHSLDTRFTRPEDLHSLGNMDIWKNSYCVVVSETEPTDPWQISEKTWKPILGLRPYMLNGNAGVSVVLKELGFFTPADLFNNELLNYNNITGIISQLKLLSIMSSEELYKLWTNQYKMLEHNRTVFIDLARKGVDFSRIN